MRLLILTNYFPPEVGGAAHLYYEMAETLAAAGHQVTVVTGFPRYNVKERAAAYRRRLLVREQGPGFRVIRLWMPPLPRSSSIIRGVEHFLIAGALLVGGLLARQHDVILCYSPPLPLGISTWLLARLWGARAAVNIQDLFPREAVMLGLLRSRPLIRLLEAIERFIYRHADCIITHSPSNREYVISAGGAAEKTHVVHNWADTERIQPAPRENRLRAKSGLHGQFVVSYAGTMGWCQDTGVIIEAASRLRDHPIRFLLVGDGPGKQEAESRTKQLGLQNVTFLPTQPWDVYPEVLHASDVGMINLNRNLTSPVVPSKLLNIMAAGRPVVASLPLNGDAPKIVEDAACGFCVDAGDINGLAGAILRLYENPELASQMGKSGREYAERHFSRQTCVRKLEQLLVRLP
jgi:glycosyltransferase involved in cell wall biosynthesis